MAHLSFAFLGVFQALRDGVVLAPLRSTRLQALLAYLILEARQVHNRDTLSGVFWPDEPQPVARQNLRQALYQLRRVLHDNSDDLLILSREAVHINPSAKYILDVTQFREHLRANRLSEAVALYQGELLPQLTGMSDIFEEWLLLRREELHLLALDTFARLTEQALARDDPQAAGRYARRQLALEPWREEAHRQLMVALAQSGERGAALAQYETCRRVLAEELGVAPEDETTLVWQRIQNGEKVPLLWQQREHSAHEPAAAHAPQIMRDWGEAPEPGQFYGREDELQRLSMWLSDPSCRLIGVIGMGGIGKTTLVRRVLHNLSEGFEVVIWRSLLNAPTLDDLIEDWLHVLVGAEQLALPASLPMRLNALFAHIQHRRCLLVLDNGESILDGTERAGGYAAGYEQYGQLFTRAGQSMHQSCFVLTSRVLPREVARLASEHAAVHILALEGCDTALGTALLADRGLQIAPHGVAILVDHYSGNPLALKLVADTIAGLFGGDVGAFIGEQTLIFDDIRDILDQQFRHLPTAERILLLLLAIAREPLNEVELWALAGHNLDRHAFVEASHSLLRRSLLEHSGGAFRIQNVVTEYLTNDLISQICAEIEHSQPAVLEQLALLNTGAKQYVVQSQQRVLLQPIGARLIAAHGRAWLARRIADILVAARLQNPLQPGFLAGNMLNLMLSNGLDVRGLDVSYQCVWQAYLRGADLPELNLTGADLRGSVFTDYVGAAMSVAISPDGSIIATGADNGAIYLWNAYQRELVGICHGHTAQVWSLCFSPDGRLLASASDDRSARIWDVARHETLHVLSEHRNGVACVAFNPDASILATASTDDDVRIWDIASGHLLRTLADHTGMVISVAFSPDGEALASASHDQTVRIWDWRTGTLKHILDAHSRPVVAVAYATLVGVADVEQRTLLASASHDQTVCIWDVRSYELLGRLSGHSAPVLTLAFNADATLLITGSDDQTMRIWDVAALVQHGEARTLRLLRGHYGAIFALATWQSGGQELLVSVSPDKTTRIWELGTGQALGVLCGHSKWLQAIIFAPDGQLLVSGSDGRHIVIWDGATGRTHKVLQGHTSLTEKLSASADGTRLVSAGWDATARIWDVRAAQSTHVVLHGHTAPVVTAVLGQGSRGQTIVVSGGLDCTIRLWDADTGHAVGVWHGHRERVAALAFQPGGVLLASGSWDKTIGLWDKRTGELLRFLDSANSPVESVTFSPDGRLVAGVGWDAIVRIWNIETGQCVHSLKAHTNGLEMVTFSPDGHLLASCGCDHLVCVWDVATGRLVHRLEGHSNWVRCVAFDPSGQLLASGSDDGTLHIWDVSPGAGVSRQTVRMHDPYTGMLIAHTSGLTAVQKMTLIGLGAIDSTDRPDR